MRSAAGILIVAFAAQPICAEAQVSHRVDSGGSDVVVTYWQTSGEPTASVLLVPGWGGGPFDVLGIAHALSGDGVETFVLTPRGWHQSDGKASFSNTLRDIGAALRWARKRASHELVLGGHSHGGGLSLVYASQDPSVRRILSVAGTDHRILIQRYLDDAAFAADFRPLLESTLAPAGPIRADADAIIHELIDGREVFGLQEKADALADRSILLLGGWEDVNVTVDESLLPFYRALRAAGATDVTFHVFHTDHGFGNVREKIHREILSWLGR